MSRRRPGRHPPPLRAERSIRVFVAYSWSARPPSKVGDRVYGPHRQNA